jgi:hypothetical protein
MAEEPISATPPSPPGPSSPPTPPPGPPADYITPYTRYTPEWDEPTWQREASQMGLGVGEAKDLLPAARRAVTEFGGHGLQQVLTEAKQLGMDGAFTRALGHEGRSYTSLEIQLEELRSEISRKAQRQGVRVPPPPRVAPLSREALSREVDRLLDRHFSSRKDQMAAFLGRQAVRATAQNIVQATHEGRAAVEYYQAKIQELDQQWESGKAWRELPDGSQLRLDEVQILIDEAWGSLAQLKRDPQASPSKIKALSKRIDLLNRVRFGAPPDDAA